MNRRPRVLVVSHADRVWGAETVALRLAPELAAAGIDVHLACPRGELAARWTELGLPVVELNVPPHQGLRSDDGSRAGPAQLATASLAVARSTVRIARLARSVDADVVHSNTLNAHLEVALAARITRTPAVLHVHDLVVPGVGRKILGIASRAAFATVAISRVVAECVPAGRVMLVPNGVDTEIFAPGARDANVRRALGGVDGLPLVGVLGRLDPEKRIELVVEAVARLPRQLGVRLAVVGSPFRVPPSYADALRHYAETRLPGRVVFVPARADVPEVLRALDVVASAAAAEPFGLTVLEAQAAGVPVVAVPRGGIPDFVTDGETGLLADTVEGLAAAIERVITDAKLARAIAERARAVVLDRYTVKQQAAHFAQLYRAAAAKGRVPADVRSSFSRRGAEAPEGNQERIPWS